MLMMARRRESNKGLVVDMFLVLILLIVITENLDLTTNASAWASTTTTTTTRRRRAAAVAPAAVAFLTRRPLQVLPQHKHSRSSLSTTLSSASTTMTATTEVADEKATTTAATFRSKYWIDQDFFRGKGGNELKSNLNRLVVEGREEEEKRDDEKGDDDDKRPSSSASTALTTPVLHRNKDGKVIAVQISNAISENEADTVQDLAKWIRCHNSTYTTTIGDKNQLFVHRSFGEGKGGNDCTYLAPILQAYRPSIANTVVNIATQAWEVAGWGKKDGHYPHPKSLGIRTSEHLSYDGWKSLEAHKDVGSTYTTMIALADPVNDYDGGNFFVQNSMFDSTDIRPERLSAVVFLSNTTHGVRPITDGRRESFVTELWTNDDAPLGMNRPTPEEWEVFVSSSAS